MSLWQTVIYLIPRRFDQTRAIVHPQLSATAYNSTFISLFGIVDDSIQSTRGIHVRFDSVLVRSPTLDALTHFPSFRTASGLLRNSSHRRQICAQRFCCGKMVTADLQHPIWVAYGGWNAADVQRGEADSAEAYDLLGVST